MTTLWVENPYAGQGPVLVDVGADSAALVITCPDALVGQEIGIRRLEGWSPDGTGHGDGPVDPHEHPPHVGVLPRPVPSGRLVASAVFPDLAPGHYRLWVLPAGPARVVHLPGGQVTCFDWGAA